MGIAVLRISVTGCCRRAHERNDLEILAEGYQATRPRNDE